MHLISAAGQALSGCMIDTCSSTHIVNQGLACLSGASGRRSSAGLHASAEKHSRLGQRFELHGRFGHSRVYDTPIGIMSRPRLISLPWRQDQAYAAALDDRQESRDDIFDCHLAFDLGVQRTMLDEFLIVGES